MYNERVGKENTDRTIDVAFEYALKNHIRHIVVASTTGYTAKRVFERRGDADLDIVVVTHNTGFKAEGDQEFPETLRNELTNKGVKVLTGTMALRGINTAIRETMGYSEGDLIANTLRIFSQGIKVCVEIVAMAADSGYIPFSDVIAISGTGHGADTACLIKANSSNRFFKIKVKEIIIKPREF
jgi:hypothetical protein